MARYKPPKKPKSQTIWKWLGVNESVGETEIDMGESVYQRNFRITKNYKPQKREGYTEFIDTLSGQPVNQGWIGRLGAKEVLIYDSNGTVYEYNFGTELSSTVSALPDELTDITYFDGKLYLLDGTTIYTYDGTTFASIDGYIPVVEIGGEPDGTGAESFEEINLLQDNVYVWRLGNGSSTQFDLLFDVDAVDSVTVDGVSATYSFVAPRTVTITSGTPADNANVIIECDLGSNSATTIESNTRAVVFGYNESQLFLFGADNNTIYVSGLGDGSYYAVNSFSKVRTPEQPITDLKAINDRLIAFKADSADYTFAQENPLYSTNVGLNKYIYEFFDLNDKYGSLSRAEVVERYPMTLDGGAMQRWSYASVVNNIDPSNISDRIRLSLEDEDLSTAVTFNYKRLKEYWVNIGSIVYIYNYGTDVFYMFDSVQATWFLETDDYIYFGTPTGTIERFEADTLTDNGTAILARLELAFTAYGMEEYLKNIQFIFPTISSADRSSLTIKFATDEDNEEANEAFRDATYVLFNYGNIDYGSWGYNTNRNPQSETIRTDIRNFQYIKWIFENEEEDETLTIQTFKAKPDAIKERR